MNQLKTDLRWCRPIASSVGSDPCSIKASEPIVSARRSALGLFVLAGAVAACLAADGPRLIPFQGRIIDAAGRPLADGTRLMQFQIFGEPTAGIALWAGELHRVTVNQGLVNVMLGTKNPLPGGGTATAERSFFDRPLYLQITVDANEDSQITDMDPPLLPRQAMVPLLFAHESSSAFNARKLQGFDWSVLFGAGDPLTTPLRPEKIGPKSIDGSMIADATIGARNIGPTTVVRSINALTDDVMLEFGPGLTLTTNGNVLRISAARNLQFSKLDIDATVNSRSYTSVGLQVSLRVKSGQALVSMTGTIANSNGGGYVEVRINRDSGTEYQMLGRHYGSSASNWNIPLSFEHLFTGLSDDTHVFSVEWRTGSAGAAHCEARSQPDVFSMRLIAEDVFLK